MSRGPVIVVGEALVDLAPDAAGALHPHLGGGPFNVARALGRLEQPVAFVGRVATDRFGDSLAAALAADSVTLHPGLRDERPTALALAELDERGQAAYRFYFAGSAAEALTPGDALACAPADASAVYVGGLGLALEPLATASEAMVAAHRDKALLFMDPNVRPAAIPDMTAYRARLDRVLAQVDVVKVSDADLAILFPGVDPDVVAQDLLTRGPKVVLLTLGERGAVAFGAFGRVAAAAPRVQVVDTIGAGDAFCGAWIARWLEVGSDLADAGQVLDAATFAVLAAAFSCAHAGATAPTRAQVPVR